MEALLISERLFKMYSPIKEDTIVDKFMPFILVTQRMYIQEILGDPLMSQLQEQIVEKTVTPDNRILLEQIAPALSFYTVYQGLPFHWASIQNKGITKDSSPNSESIELEDLGHLQQFSRNTAEQFRNQLVDFLCNNKEKYPLWRPPYECGCNEATADITQDSGIYIPTWDK